LTWFATSLLILWMFSSWLFTIKSKLNIYVSILSILSYHLVFFLSYFSISLTSLVTSSNFTETTSVDGVFFSLLSRLSSIILELNSKFNC
jgi:hypothetical protein